MIRLKDFEPIVKRNEPLGKYTFSKLGGVCEILAEPTSVPQFSALYKACLKEKIPVRILGNGCNLLVRTPTISGVVVRMTGEIFCGFQVKSNLVNIGAGASVMSAISFLSRNNFCGLEAIAGVPGTIGGAVLSNTSDKTGPISRFVQRIHVLDAKGDPQIREKDELSFCEKGQLDDPVILSVEFAFEKDNTESIVKRLRKTWVSRKIQLPLGVPYAGKIFRNPRGLTAASLIEQAGQLKAKVGNAEICDRDPNYIVLQPGATAEEVVRLIENVRKAVLERFNIDMEPEITIW